jgi:ferredoxin/flavodoxin---NADP+ reductase
MTPEEITQQRHTRYNATVVSLRKVHSDLMVMRVHHHAGSSHR